MSKSVEPTRGHSTVPVIRSFTRPAGVAETVGAVPVVAQEALGRGAVVVEAEARAVQPLMREGSLGQNRHGSREASVSLLPL